MNLNLFSSQLKRSELLKCGRNLDFSKSKEIHINVHRNHAFEPVMDILYPFLHFSNLNAIFNISSYDDSLNFDSLKKADLELVWLDLARYKAGFENYLQSRLVYLREHSKANILVLLTDDKNSICNLNTNLSNCEIFDISKLLSLSKNELFDESKASITGTRLSNIACIKLAQILGLSLIPSLVLPSLKAIVVDLDNTLYKGVLGEDTSSNLVLTKEHEIFQKRLLEYKKQGFLLALASKNDEVDVKSLFEDRKDFLLNLSDFDKICANWDDKAKNLQKIAQSFNIGLDSILFIDDNPAEIQNVKYTGVKTILASNTNEVLNTLNLFPGLRKTNLNKEDELRSNDIRANLARQQLKELSKEEYFKNLQIELKFSINDKANIARISELLNKTNQFIANYLRPTQEEVKTWFESKNYAVVSISMKDRLSDSGNIAIVVGQSVNDELYIIDLAISCRALGRKLENIMLYEAFKLIKKTLNLKCDKLRLFYKKGERNTPFFNILSNLSNEDVKSLENKNSINIVLKEPNLKGLIIKK